MQDITLGVALGSATQIAMFVVRNNLGVGLIKFLFLNCFFLFIAFFFFEKFLFIAYSSRTN